MLPKIFDIGIGVIILSIIWVFCLFGCFTSTRKSGIQFGIIYLFFGLFLTIILLLWPREQCKDIIQQNNFNDNLIIENILKNTISSSKDENDEEIDWLAIPRLLIIIIFIGLFSCAIFRLIHYWLFNLASHNKIKKELN